MVGAAGVGKTRLVLAVDDGHLLDEASATLIHQLAATATVFVLVTVRAGEPVLDPILALWKDGLTEYIELAPLSQPESKLLVEQALAGDLDGATTLALWEATLGNPLFLRELVVEGLDQGTLVETGGVWRARGSIAPGARLAGIVEARLRHLAPDEHDALELLAVGEPIGVDLLSAITAPGALEQLQRTGLLAEERADRRLDVRLAHPLYGEVVRARTPLQRQLVARLADGLEARGARRREDLLRLASWRLETGTSGPPEVLIAAAARAQASFDPVLAERLAAAAVAGGGGLPARLTLAVAMTAQARFVDAEAMLANLEPLAGDDEQKLRVADARAANLFWGMGRADQAQRILLAAETQIGVQTLCDELAAIRAAQVVFTGRPLEALVIVRPILDRYEPATRIGARAALAAVTALALTGGAREARALVQPLREPVQRLAGELPFLPGQLLAAYSFTLTLAGWLDEGTDEAQRGYERALADHDQQAGSLWAMTLGHALMARGAVRRARSLLIEAAAGYREADVAGFRQLCSSLLCQGCALTGDRAAAERWLADAERGRRPGFHVFDPPLGLARAWTAGVAGAFSAAREHALQVADENAARGALAYAALALHDLARLGDPKPAAARLRDLSTELGNPLTTAYADHADGLAAGDGAALDRAAAAFEATGALLLAAEAFAEAGAAHREHGRGASATRSAASSNLLLQRCEGARTPALAHAGSAASLTRREREIATLAAAGLSNRGIAEQLVIPVRTVEHHLQHAYEKLGLNDRNELASILRPPRPGERP